MFQRAGPQQQKKGEFDEQAAVKGGEFRRIMKNFRRKPIFFVACFLSLIAGASPSGMMVIMGQFTNALATKDKDELQENVLNIVKVMAIYQSCVCVMMLCLQISIGFSSPFFMADMRKALYNKYMRIEISHFDQTQTGTILSKFTHDCALMNEVYITKFIQILHNLGQTVGGIAVGLVLQWRVTLICLVAFVISAAVFWIAERIVGKLWEEFNKNTADADTTAEEVIISFRTVKSFDNEILESDRYGRSLNALIEIYKKISLIMGAKDGIIHLVMHFMITFLMYFSSYVIVKKTEWGMAAGDLMAILFSLIFSIIGVTQTLVIIDDFNKASVSAASVLRILEYEPEIDQREGAKMDKEVKGKVEFRDVAFKYKGREDYAVKGLSFVVNPGETVAFVGESGCGKSTTLQLLQRFYEIESGQILVDDVDIKTLAPNELRKYISIVPQSPVLFTMSINDNIRYAVPNATSKSVARAAEIGNAHSFISSMPDGYKTQVEQTSLSGGQKQRVCISRAILYDAPIMLLDEATAALDTNSEKLVQESLEKIRKGKTAIMVAHRLATVINADRIFVFKDGRIIEVGTHTSLLQSGGIYADLVKFQLQ